jgi:hypothetical protein
MKLSETNEQIKADLMKFVNGEYDDYFTKEQIAMATEISFLLNHISSEGDSVIFKYNNDKVKISGLNDLPNFSEETIIHHIKSEEVFKRSYKSFLREHKLNKLLGDDI